MTYVAIIADDLTGATDSAALFAQSGCSTTISLTRLANARADVLSISTDSRDIPVEQAIARVTAASRSLDDALSAPAEIIYKKLDSALRGHLQAELLALMRASGIDRAVVAPALPSEERTTRNGRQYIHGVPLEESSFRDLGISSDIVATLCEGNDDLEVTLVTRAALRGLGPAAFGFPGIHVADARSDDDLDLIAKHARRADVRLLAGSAGLARAIVRTRRWRPRIHLPVQERPGNRPILVLAGSRHSSTSHQIEFAAAHGITVLRPEQTVISDPAATVDLFREQVAAELTAGRHVIATTSGLQDSPLGAGTVVERLSEVIASTEIQELIGGLMLTGGDVAAAVCARLAARAITLRGEVLPAIPWGNLDGGSMPGLAIVTKAGSFGTPRTILTCIEHLAAQQRG